MRFLTDHGNCEFRILDSIKDKISVEDQTNWAKTFVEIEHAGWKGKKGTSFASDECATNYFDKSIKSWFANGKLLALELVLDNVVIASLYVTIEKTEDVLIARSQKTTYVEQYSKGSPGVHALLHINKYLLDNHNFKFIDACTTPDNDIINAFMKQKQTTSSFLVSSNGTINQKIFSFIHFLEISRINMRQNIKILIHKLLSHKKRLSFNN
ncbi:MAG: hypothetical protein HRU28_11460 [Rhizobiales bacterium]|nr:hypothetical protein [Hyphomicrobiales bacterium]